MEFLSEVSGAGWALGAVVLAALAAVPGYLMGRLRDRRHGRSEASQDTPPPSDGPEGQGSSGGDGS
ncbi:MAG: hypothetical protein AAFP13_08210 [Pseudomonadota bacterium]